MKTATKLKEDLKPIPDLDLVRKFRSSKNSDYIYELIRRYEHFLLKVLSRWNSRNKYCVKLNPTDFNDAKQYVYLSVMLFANRVKDLNKVKNVSVSLKCYAYTTLNKYYRHRKYENTNCEENSDSSENEIETAGYEDKKNRGGYTQQCDLDNLRVEDFDSYCILMRGYTSYKMAMMMTGLKSKLSMRKFHRDKRVVVRSKFL